MAEFIDKRLGKGIVYAKDTPNFIANRIGVYAICNCMRHMIEMGMTVEEVDAIAGPATARPKSATFRTADLVGIDTLQHVADNSYELLVQGRGAGGLPAAGVCQGDGDKGLLGNKSETGFFQEGEGEKGQAYFYYDYNTGEYLPSQRPKFASVEAAKPIDDPGKRLQAVIDRQRQGGPVRLEEPARHPDLHLQPDSGDRRRHRQYRQRHEVGLQLGARPLRDARCHRRRSTLWSGRKRTVSGAGRTQGDRAILQIRERQELLLRHPRREDTGKCRRTGRHISLSHPEEERRRGGEEQRRFGASTWGTASSASNSTPR